MPTTTMAAFAYIQVAGDSYAPGLMALGAGLVLVIPIVGLVIGWISRRMVGG